METKTNYWMRLYMVIVELVKKSDCAQRQRAAFVELVESISRKAQKQGQSRLHSCLASLGTTFGRAQKFLFWAGTWFFTSSIVPDYFIISGPVPKRPASYRNAQDLPI